jgi:hypothetical protein
MGGSPAPPPAPTPPDYSAQFSNLQSGQSTIRQDISGLNTGFKDESRDIQDKLYKGFNEQEDRFDDIDSGLTGLGNTVDTGFSDMGTQITGLGTDVGNRLDTFDQNMNTNFTGLGNQVETGFTGLGNQVDSRFNTLNDGMNTGFATVMTDMGTGFTNLGNTVQQGDQALMQGQEEGFAGVNENVTNVGANLGNQLTETSANVLAGQLSIQDLVNQYGANQDTYFQALSQGQTESQARQAALQTGLDQFRGDYDRNTTLANQQRGRIQDAVVGGQAQIGEQIAQSSDAQSRLLGNVGQSVQQVGQTANNIESAQAKDFSRIAKQIATGFDDGSAETASARNEFIDRLNTVRTVLQDQGANIDAGIRETYSTLVSSFDDQGALIQSSANADGSRISRALDQQGNLLLAAFDRTGTRVDQQSLDINRMMSQMDQFGYRPGSNAAMGSMSPGMTATQPAAVYSGFASPFAQTR